LIKHLSKMNLYVVLLTLAAVTCGCAALNMRETIVQQLEDKYCPFYGFNGAYCPQQKKTSNGTPQMLSGIGYNRAKRSLRWPVLNPTSATSAPQQNFFTTRYPTPRDYLSFIYSAGQSMSGGLYATDDAIILQILTQFNDYRQNIGVTQKEFKSFTGGVASMEPQSYFLEYLKTIPPVYDPKNSTLVYDYTQLIEEFGTEVATTADFGGMIYLLAAVKACYGGAINGDIEKEIDNLINKEPTGPYAYLKYRKLGIYDVKGGNPELSLQTQAPQRIASMAQNPVMTRFTSVPLWQVVPQQWQEPLKAAIADYLTKFQPTIEQWIAAAEAQKITSYKAGQSMTIFHRNTEQCCDAVIRDVASPLVQGRGFVYVPRFSIPRWGINIVAGQTNEFTNYVFQGRRIHYSVERDANGNARLHGWSTGAFANATVGSSYTKMDSHTNETSVEEIDLEILKSNGDVYSSFVHTGCTDVKEFYITRHPERFTYYTVCIDCQSYVTTSPAQRGVQHYDVQCGCPGF
jgi:hypothetical protein